MKTLQEKFNWLLDQPMRHHNRFAAGLILECWNTVEGNLDLLEARIPFGKAVILHDLYDLENSNDRHDPTAGL